MTYDHWLLEEIGPNYASVYSCAELEFGRRAWQASSKALQERCAKVCVSNAEDAEQYGGADPATTYRCAETIRPINTEE